MRWPPCGRTPADQSETCHLTDQPIFSSAGFRLHGAPRLAPTYCWHGAGCALLGRSAHCLASTPMSSVVTTKRSNWGEPLIRRLPSLSGRLALMFMDAAPPERVTASAGCRSQYRRTQIEPAAVRTVFASRRAHHRHDQSERRSTEYAGGCPKGPHPAEVPPSRMAPSFHPPVASCTERSIRKAG